MAMRGRTARGGPTPRTDRGDEAGDRVVTAVSSSKTMRQANAGATPARPGKISLLSERINTGFFRDAFGELRRVTWPTRPQATNLTALVIGVSFAVGLILGAFDYIFEKIFGLFVS